MGKNNNGYVEEISSIFEDFIDFKDFILKNGVFEPTFLKMTFFVVVVFFSMHILLLLDVSVQPNHRSG